MTDSSQSNTSRQYTATIALLALAIAAPFSGLLLAPGPVGTTSMLVALTLSATCIAAAWAQWKWRSRLSVPSIAIQRGSRK
jgi:hypothetical protein